MYLGFWRLGARKPAPLLGVGEKCASKVSKSGEKGEVIADYLTQRVWLWDGEEARARCWHLLVRREIDGSKLKFCLSNAKSKASLRRLAEMC